MLKAEPGVCCRRRGFLGVVLGCSLLWVLPAFAGSYLNRAAVLLAGAELEAKVLQRRLYDKELARVTHRLALTRVAAGNEMQVPVEVKNAHPHLLLSLESFERAADGAARGDHEDFLVALARAREERRIFVAVLKEAGWDLPKT
jgi:hypothetical protein